MPAIVPVLVASAVAVLCVAFIILWTWAVKG